MAFLTDCDHPRCDGGPCRQLTPEELEPTPEEALAARELVLDGWVSTSNKYRHIRRWKLPPPHHTEVTRTLLLNPALAPWAETLPGKFWSPCIRTAPRELYEERTLSVRMFRAFRKAGGTSE